MGCGLKLSWFHELLPWPRACTFARSGSPGGKVGLCKNILVTEDNEDTREMLVRILESAGYQVQSASNGEEALKILDSTTLSTLVLLDMMMPVMDGWHFLKDKRRGEHKVVSISAVRADVSEDYKSWEGLDGILPKPLFAADVLNLVEKFCDPN